MEAPQAFRKFTSGRLLSTREGTIVVGVGAAVLAGIIIFAYVNQYRHSVNAGAAQVSVLVARNLIENGTPGEVVASTHRFQVTSIPKDDVKPGAFTDPGTLTGKVATKQIYPNQQLTAADFAVGTGGLGPSLHGNQRAMSIPVDNVHGLVGQLQAGDYVDIYASLTGVVKELYQDVYVVYPAAGGGGGLGGGTAGNVVLRLKPSQAAKLAYVADNGKVWLVLRPRAGAPKTKGTAANGLNVLTGNGR